ncbi:MAG: Beta-xylosidase [Microgenomates group bacterium ADurb.Bin219]|nr:MAG: Beta-xylosidase [Microgenomates group bacterium ADurb.Bin219]HNP89509.1 hypothetical protein [Candidatus Woesebacteria bacterium]
MKKLIGELLFLILVGVIFLVSLKTIRNLAGRAEKTSVTVNIDGASPQIFPKIWQGFGQGGEETTKIIAPVSGAVAELMPSYIRIDHLFDFSQVVSRDERGEISYHWEELDERIAEITAVGALPFLSLSYLPPIFSASNSIISLPSSITDWENLIRATIERYSGRNGKNLSNLYYEVWNEPDVFGKFKPAEYFSLYLAAAKAAESAIDCQPFKFGGPAILGVNKTWLNDFLGLVKANNLRLDFVSWHSYGANPKKIKLEAGVVDNLPNFNSFRKKTEKVVTEWGSDSEMSANHDSFFDASHTLATVGESFGAVDLLLAFELKDGLDPKGNQFWGRWGLLTHQEKGSLKKPRYAAFTLLNENLKYFLPADENGLNVYGLSSTDGKGNFVLFLTSFPYSGANREKDLSVSLHHFLPGEFEESVSFFGSETNPESNLRFQSSGRTWQKSFNLKPFTTAVIKLRRLSPASTRIPAEEEEPGNFAAQIIAPLPPLVFPLFDGYFSNQEDGEISFSLRFSQTGAEAAERFLFESRVSPSIRLYAKTRSEGFANFLDFVFEQGEIKKSISLDIGDWQAGKWYDLNFTWSNPLMEMKMKINDREVKESTGANINLSLGKFLTVGADADDKNFINADLDNFLLKMNGREIIWENFN